MGLDSQARYSRLQESPDHGTGDELDTLQYEAPLDARKDGKKKRLVVCSLLVVFWGLLAVFWYDSAVSENSMRPPASDHGRLRPQPTARGRCDTVHHGYRCIPDISRHWGQYSPYFSVPSSGISDETPSGCRITFVNILSRHGARHPTPHKTELYRDTVSRIQSTVPRTSLQGKYAFLNDYEYRLGAGELNEFGDRQMANSGVKFFERYRELAVEHAPFIRAASKPRVVDSAKSWATGYHETKRLSHEDREFPYDLVVIQEGDEFNNTLAHSRCEQLEHGAYHKIGHNAQRDFVAVFAPPIVDRLNADLPGVSMDARDAINLMQMCPFDTVSDPGGTPSPFCGLFSTDEFRQLAYYETLDKYYGFGPGNPVGATQGVGFVNELLARMTGRPVEDDTSTNSTLDGSDDTFPLNRTLYADFSHDNDLAGIFSALGLYNSTPTLPKTEVLDEDETAGFSASWVVPFASRAYFEKMVCGNDDNDNDDELVRVIINDRVVPLVGCDADELGRCSLTSFVQSQGFARSGGHWDKCFA